MQTALILVDIQNEYFAGGGRPCVGMPQAVANAARLLAHFRQARPPRLFHIRHVAASPDAPVFADGSHGAQIHDSVAPRDGEPVISKHFPNSFRQTTLQQQLQAASVGHVVICGAMSHMCVDATTRAAFDLGLQCTVVEDACATLDLKYHGEVIPAATVHAAFMAALAYPYAKVTTTDAFLGDAA